MRVSLPHSLSKDEVRRRMQKHAGDIGSFFPAGLAMVTTDWPHEDRMTIIAEVMGQAIPGGVEVRDTEVVIEMDLPLLFAVMKGPLEAAVKKEGARLLVP
jgi:hypothetical protein